MNKRVLLWRFLPVLVLLGLAVLFFWALNRPDRNKLPSARLNEPVPSFTLPALHDKGSFTKDVFSGQWSLLNVWATWCPTCHVEHPYLMELSRRGVRIVGLNYKDELPKARSYLEQRGNPFALTLVDRDGQYGMDLGVYGAPETYVINPEGVILLRHVGELDRQAWREKIAPVWGGEKPYE